MSNSSSGEMHALKICLRYRKRFSSPYQNCNSTKKTSNVEIVGSLTVNPWLSARFISVTAKGCSSYQSGRLLKFAFLLLGSQLIELKTSNAYRSPPISGQYWEQGGISTLLHRGACHWRLLRTLL